jgi:TonB-linked SusC/RagA family outer membrane protein
MVSGNRLMSTPLVAALFALLLALPAQVGAQQTGTIRGRVIDASSMRPLVGAQVTIPATGRGSLTNSAGEFLIPGVPTGAQTVRVQMLGYAAQQQPVTIASGETAQVQFQLEQQAVALDELVVTGTPGAQLARSLGNTVAKVNAAELTAVAPPANIESMLSGGVPGMSVAVSGGEVGSGANIRIRGASSVSLSSQPLLYVDGVRVNNNNADLGGGIGSVGGDSRNPPSRLNDINPDDIESIEVIKGPAASTLYGTEASNGVINIITKKGAVGKPTFNLTVKQGANWYPDPESFFPTTAFRCRGTSGTCTPGEVVDFNVLREDRIRNGTEVFQTGRPQSYGANVSGGSEGLRYYFSLDWDRDEGVVDYNWQNKLSGRANLNWTPREDLSLQFGLGSVRSNLRSASAIQPITTAIYWSCPAPGCEAGSKLPNAVDGIYRGYIAYLPEVLRDKVFGYQNVSRNTFNLSTTHTPREWFTHRLVLGADFTDGNNSELYRHLEGGVGHFRPEGQKDTQRQTTEYFSADYSLTATVEPMAGLSLATSGGVQYYEKSNEWIWSMGRIFAVPALETVSAGALKSTEEDFLENKTFGAFVQEQISWQNRLFLTAAVRGDDNSAFGQNFDFVVYPKLSASWVVSEEPFMGGLGWLNSLRLRGAWGQAGQQPDIFAALRLYQPTAGPGGAGMVTPLNLGNPDIKPEVGEEIEVGFDAGVLDDRLGIEFTYYNQARKDALVRVPVKPSTGFPGFQFANIGEITNQGFELALRGSAYQTDNVGLELEAAFSTNENELVSMGGLPPQQLQEVNYTTGWARQRYVEGFPLGAIFLPKVVSADVQNSGTPQAKAVNVMCEGGEVIPGTNLSRGGGAPVPCAQAPEIYRGAPVPTREFSGRATLTLFRDLQLFAQVDYQGGHTMINGNAAGAHLFFRNTRAILERTDPILLGYESLGSLGMNQAGLVDASFAKLRNVSASYTLPQPWADRVAADRLTLTLSGHNLWTIWQATKDNFGYRLVDPEMRVSSGTATDPGGLSAYQQDLWPPMRRFLATVRVTF